MLKQTAPQGNELEGLLRELDGITEDLTTYVNFLIARQDLIEHFVTDYPALNN